MKWQFFVIDFDDTYSLEQEESQGVAPMVYMVPEDMLVTVASYAKMSKEEFHERTDDMGIGDIFLEHLKQAGIDAKEVGPIDLTFGERQLDYLADNIAVEVV